MPNLNVKKPHGFLRRVWGSLFAEPSGPVCFAPPISFNDVINPPPDQELLARYGQYHLLKDTLTVLRSDGTVSYDSHVITVLHSSARIAAWDTVRRSSDRRIWTLEIERATVTQPGGRPRAVPVRQYPTSEHEFWLEMNFAPLRPGVTVELSEQWDTLAPDQFGAGIWGDYPLQGHTPCRRRRLTLAVAHPFALRLEFHNGATAPEEFQAGNYRVYVWDFTDQPGTESDPFTPSDREYLPWVDFSTLKTWTSVAKRYGRLLDWSDSKRNTQVWAWPGRDRPAVNTIAKQLTDKAESDRARALTLYEHAARDVRYGRPGHELQNWASRPLETMAGDLRGDCKDKSALLVALLTAVGIPAHFVLVATAQYGRQPRLPGQRFNHVLVVARLDGEEVWLDPAAMMYTFGELPTYDQGVSALVLEPDGPTYRPTPPPQPDFHRTDRVCRGALTADGRYTLAVHKTATGDHAAWWRALAHGRDGGTAARLLKQAAAAELPGAAVGDVACDHLEDLRGPVALSFAADRPGLGRRVLDLILLRIPWFQLQRDTGFSAADRVQPLANPVYRFTDRHEIELPPGWAGYGLPEPAAVSCEWFEYRNSIREVDGRLICERELLARGGHVVPERFAELRQFWAECYRFEEADVILTHGDRVYGP